MGKYSEDGRKLLEYVGGKENVAAVSHCVTRMRFVLNDPAKADVKAIEALSCAKGTFTQAGQFQVIIGNEVSSFYNDFIAVSGLEGMTKDAVKSAAKQNQSVLQRLMSSLAEIFAPLIPAIIVGGLILGFRNIIGEIALFDGGTKTLTQISVFWAGINSFLWLIGEAVFHFLPVCIVWSITKKMGTTQALGIVLGITLVSPQLLNAYSVATTAAAEIPKWNFGAFQVDMIGYQAQVLPAMLAGFTLVYLERFFRKICPAMISMIVVPFCSLLLAVVVAHGILGPIGWKIGSVVSDFVNAGLTSTFKGVFAAIFGFFYAPLVITGLHHMSNAIDLQLVADFGGTNLWPMIALSNIAQGSAVLAMIRLQKNDAKAREVSVPSCISCYLGVTEPAMFGVNLKYGFPFICGMIGSAIAAVVSITSGIRAQTIGVGGIPGILSIQPQYMAMFAVCMAIVIVVPFCLTYVVGKRKGIGAGGEVSAARPEETAAQSEQIAARSEQIAVRSEEIPARSEQIAPRSVRTGNDNGGLLAFATGKVAPVEAVPDQVFSAKVLGDGIAVWPEDGVLRAPACGTVAVVMEESLHACGILLDNGMELLFHIGLDTVDMKGDGFTAHVKVGDRVKAGDELISFNRSKIKAAGHEDVVIMVITNPGSVSGVNWEDRAHVSAGTDVIGRIQTGGRQ